MHRLCTRAFVLALALAALAGAARGDEKARPADVFALEETIQEAIKRAEPSIACILVSRSADAKNQALDDPDVIPESYGRGVVLDEKGVILTNYRVVREATLVYIRLPGDKAGWADAYAGDPRSDLAVLRLREPKALPLKAIKLGDGGAVRKGQIVISLANPFAAGFRDGSPSASWGILSNIRRRAPGDPKEHVREKTLHRFGTLLQTDARLNLGCSGGALLDLKGELIGLTTPLAAITGGEAPGGFAVPMDAGMRRIIDVLKRGEEVEYGFLGVSFPESRDLIRQAVRQGHGLPVGMVVPGSPAAERRLRGDPRGMVCDYILSVNGARIQEPDDLFLALGTMLAGSTVKLEVAHGPGERPEVLAVTLAKFYVPEKGVVSKRPDAVAGLRVDYTSILYLRPGGEQIYRRGIPKGVMIREVVSGSAADTARLQPDKVITHVNGREVNDPGEFYREMQKAQGPVELTIQTSDGREDRVKIDLK